MKNYLLSPYMPVITKAELRRIVNSYSIENPHFLGYEQVEPDVMLYYLQDQAQNYYVLLATDYAGNFDEQKLPRRITFDYYENHSVSIAATRLLPRTLDEFRAPGYNNDQFLTPASTGDVCLLFACEKFDADPIEAQPF